MIVPYAAGGGSDVIARNVAERMKASLGQPVIIENITGASGTIGTGRVAHARPDGYMLGIGNVNTHVTAAHDIPTVDEAGLPGFYAPYWYGLWAPPHTSSPSSVRRS
jgi:tripartite-type tricarboxylate transporter receptor subunit TctC